MAQPATMPTGSLSRERQTLGISFLLAAIVLVVHLSLAGRYGYFRDEFYFLACSEHLDWGYVDHAPLIDWLARLSRTLIGDSLYAIRLLPALAGAATVLITGLIARELGGGRFAVALACLSVLLAPIYLGMDHLLTMNALEPLLWMGSAYVLLLAIKRDNPKLLVWFGVLIGLGLQNKHSIIFFAAALVAGLLVTKERRLLLNRWLWIGAALGILIVLPQIIWQATHNWPMLETLETVKRTHKNIELGPAEFLWQQILMLSVVSLLVWGGGLLFLLRSPRYAALGWAYIVTLGLMIALKGKNYYLAPAYPMLFAAGGVWWERLSAARRWLRIAVLAPVVALGLVSVPFVIPLLTPEGYVRYTQILHFEPPKTERGHRGPLPQHFGDMFGWPEMVEKVAAVYNALPPAERARAAIYANNYGEAGAVDLLGGKYGLPKSISAHNNYWLWGPRNYTGDIMIVLGEDVRRTGQHFATCEVGPLVSHPYAMSYEQFNILTCRGLKVPLPQAWTRIKTYN